MRVRKCPGQGWLLHDMHELSHSFLAPCGCLGFFLAPAGRVMTFPSLSSFLCCLPCPCATSTTSAVGVRIVHLNLQFWPIRFPLYPLYSSQRGMCE
ncbi:hypothetical protein M752DRAFT_50550 [Aspergillus phoenicis ATCC 13157]|uniref:Uncharacterized protein n=2 Tax=Aspergillus TaxID=5052 RepID=A0A370PBL5_ASPPH|nr:hypothetical protein M747DRAFT_146974 [Aspergillus niger ATCC 13496]RDK39578.1 hypothetical protein M752DRAFT_50550 [Aspergillus phoenicis ATCC 13157]